MSSGLDHDARAALQRFGFEARAFGAISTSLAAAARTATTAFAAALPSADERRWREFVGDVATLVHLAHGFRDIAGLRDGEADALAYFESIVDENADLLEPDTEAPPAEAAYRDRVRAAGVRSTPPQRGHCLALN